jgi:hypothetical protein
VYVIGLKKCTFLAIPKNGTSSILDAIGRSIGMKRGKANAKAYKRYFIPKNKIRKPCICFVRDPYDRAVSAWKQKCVDTQDVRKIFQGLNVPCGFEDFLIWSSRHPLTSMDQHAAPQWYQLRGVDVGVEFYDFKNLGDVWPTLMQRFGWCELPHFNKSKHEESKYYFDRVSVSVVKEWEGRFKHDRIYLH